MGILNSMTIIVNKVKSNNSDIDESKNDIPSSKKKLKPLRSQSSFKVARVNTAHRNSINRQMSALRKLDLDGDGEIQQEEFMQKMMEDGMTRDEADAEFKNLRNKYDADGDGIVTLMEARRTELNSAMEDEAEEDRKNLQNKQEARSREHKNHTKERVKNRKASESKSPAKKDARALPTKTMRSSNQNSERNGILKELYASKIKKKKNVEEQSSSDDSNDMT